MTLYPFTYPPKDLVQIQGGEVGQKPNLPDVIKYAVFFEGSPNLESQLSICLSIHPSEI